MDLFHKYAGILVPSGLPHEDCPLTKAEVLALVRKQRAVLARYTSTRQILSGGGTSSTNYGWWHCVRTEPINLDTLTAKQRYRVRRGLQRNNIFIADEAYLRAHSDDIYTAYLNSLADYPKVYRINPTIADLMGWFLPAASSGNADIWICQDKETDKIVGFAHTPYRNNVVNMSSVSLDPHFFKNEVNAALVYEICRHYLNDLGFSYICDGERNVRHQTEYQDYLVRVLGFRKAPCRLRIVYHPLVKPLIWALYPFRSLLKPFRENKLIFNLYCILFQEQCARESKKLTCL